MIYDAVIIGGGAAGLFCAFTAGQRGRRVLLIEHNAEVGRKIVISGGGRCNFTNIHTSSENFVSQNPHFAKSALSRYTPANFVDLVKSHRIPFHEKKLGQLFCSDSSRRIVEMLESKCRTSRVQILTGCSVTSVSKPDSHFRIESSRGVFETEKLVVASGGLSFPKIGATDLGYRIARQFGLSIINTRPSLVGMVIDGENYGHVAGVSIDAIVSAGDISFRENVLLTHRGLSGPAIIQISNYWHRGHPVSIDLAPDGDLDAFDLKDGRKLSNALADALPQRFADEFVRRELTDKPVSRLTNSEIAMAKAKIHDWRVLFRETEGYGRAEVTLGGVSTDELSSKTMESKTVSGLYFIGEVVDVTGWLGGYNFQWAWASGHAAGTAI